jgi:hypothetical protein
MLERDKLARLSFSRVKSFGPLNYAKYQWFRLAKMLQKLSIMCVFGLKTFNFIIEGIFFCHKIYKMQLFDQLTSLNKLASKKYGRMLP